MNELTIRDGGRLAGATIAILMESDYVEPELHYYLRRFAEEGARTILVTRLWGQPSLTFHGHEYQQPFTVDADLSDIEGRLGDLDAIIVPSGMVSDRLRYTEDVTRVAPAVSLLRAAFDLPQVYKGIICHGMWLVSPIAEVVAGRRVTCHNNLIGDVANMGARYVDQDVVVDRDLVTARSADKCHLFARMLIDLIAARRAPRALVAAPVDRSVTALLPVPAGAPRSAAAPEARVNGVDHSGSATAPAADPTPVRTPEPAPPSALGRASGPGGATVSTDTGYRPDFTFSDLVAGYVTAYVPDDGVVTLRTADGREVRAGLAPTLSAELLRNLGDPYVDAGEHLAELLTADSYVFAYGVFYPAGDDYAFVAHHLVLTGKRPGEPIVAEPDWWVRQIRELARFYRRAQFGDSYPVDYADYRTVLRLGGDKSDHFVQETDTISRLVYGMASAYLLTGEDDFLHVARRGAEYLRDHLRFVDLDEDVVYWYHGVDVRDGAEHKLFTSEFGDDYDAIPMYEQIYALAGLTQLYRVTGDAALADDIAGTLRLIRRFFRDEEGGGYFSHIDPITLSPHHESLGANRSRKNWNSVGDHAPAYLFNLYLATGEKEHADMLEECFDLIARYFPTDDSPFVQERFHTDWSPDRAWGWQQDRAVVGHNLKIAWNLTRMNGIRPKEGYRALADRLGRAMPELGSDRQRGGWYDVVERGRRDGEDRHRFVWHDRKAWWQQEQAILAYQILAGTTGDADFLREARQAATFYNAFFLDHDEGGVYFNVMAAGTPYLVGNERLKGNHSMSMYHSAELCYLATVYERLLLDGGPLTLTFRPEPGAFGGVLRVAPDALPPGRVRLDWVEVDGRPHAAFDATELTVRLPDSGAAVTVRAHLSPTGR